MTDAALVVLGAGPPIGHGEQMSLREVSGRTPLDWQLEIFDGFVDRVEFVGGYRLSEVMEKYPSLTYRYNSGWRTSGPIQSLLSVVDQLENPCDLWVVYSDVIIGEGVLEEVQAKSSEKQIVFVTEEVSPNLLNNHPLGRQPETLMVGEHLREFAGLIRLSSKIVEVVRDLDESEKKSLRSKSLHSLVEYLQEKLGKKNVSAEVLASGDWVHVEDPNAVARFVLRSKAVTLKRISGRLEKAKVADLWYVSRDDWRTNGDLFVQQVLESIGDRQIIARSSAVDEDGFSNSNAGMYESVLDVSPERKALVDAIDRVFESYGSEDVGDRVLIQPMIENVSAAGVVFTRQMNTGAPYYTLSYSSDGKTDSITSGVGRDENWTIFRHAPNTALETLPKIVRKVLVAVQEVEALTEYDRLDIEFAVNSDDEVYILQVRPLLVGDATAGVIEDEKTHELLHKLQSDMKALEVAADGAPVAEGAWSNMADWNPAEILGAQPGKLAFDLYRHLVTDEVWSVQRQEIGGSAEGERPLMRRFGAQAFIDVRASLRSFVPAAVKTDIADRVEGHALECLAAAPHLHDKIEFEVIPTCVDFSFDRWRESWEKSAVLSPEEITQYRDALLGVTSRTIERTGEDIAELRLLDERFEEMEASRGQSWHAAGQYLALCRRKGTPHFAHLARAGFVAVSLLRSAQVQGLISTERADQLRATIGTVSTDLDEMASRVKSGSVEMETLVRTFGHLRAGTYDIAAPTYGSDPEKYFRSFLDASSPAHTRSEFVWSDVEKKNLDMALAGAGFQFGAEKLLEFVRTGIWGREYGKFVFTKFLSRTLDIFSHNLEEIGISAEDARHVPLAFLLDQGVETVSPTEAREMLREACDKEEERFERLRRILLPGCITDINQLFAFKQMSVEPNFVTNERCEGTLVLLDGKEDVPLEMESCIVAIPNADPGYDYLFGLGIAGIVTAYGGPNSHMAIRASERSLPAVIGLGEGAFRKLKPGRRYKMDCSSQFFGDIQSGMP